MSSAAAIDFLGAPSLLSGGWFLDEVAATSLRIAPEVDVGDLALAGAVGRSAATPPRTQRGGVTDQRAARGRSGCLSRCIGVQSAMACEW